MSEFIQLLVIVSIIFRFLLALSEGGTLSGRIMPHNWLGVEAWNLMRQLFLLKLRRMQVSAIKWESTDEMRN